ELAAELDARVPVDRIEERREHVTERSEPLDHDALDELAHARGLAPRDGTDTRLHAGDEDADLDTAHEPGLVRGPALRERGDPLGAGRRLPLPPPFVTTRRRAMDPFRFDRDGLRYGAQPAEQIGTRPVERRSLRRDRVGPEPGDRGPLADE